MYSSSYDHAGYAGTHQEHARQVLFLMDPLPVHEHDAIVTEVQKKLQSIHPGATLLVLSESNGVVNLRGTRNVAGAEQLHNKNVTFFPSDT